MPRYIPVSAELCLAAPAFVPSSRSDGEGDRGDGEGGRSDGEACRSDGEGDALPTLEARALRGDDLAWDALIRRHQHRVVVSLLARGIPVDRAKELAQEVWMHLIARQRSGQLEVLVLPGLALAQANFFALDEHRKHPLARARGGHRSDDDGDDEEATARLRDPAADPEERLLRGEELLRAERALAGCSRSAREVFRLLYEPPGADHAEVARRVGLSLQRVRQIVCEVRKKLRAAVEEESP